jgi:hypothetical protein
MSFRVFGESMDWRIIIGLEEEGFLIDFMGEVKSMGPPTMSCI